MSRMNIGFSEVVEDMTLEVRAPNGGVIRGSVVAVTERDFTIVDDDTGWDVTIGRDEYKRLTTEKPKMSFKFVVYVTATTRDEAHEVMNAAQEGLPQGTPFAYYSVGEEN